MDDYSFWEDMFNTIRSFPDWLKLVAVLFLPLVALVPPALIVILTRHYYTYRLRRAALDHAAAAATAAAAAAMSLSWQENPGLISDQQRRLLDQPDSFLRDRAGRKDEDDLE